MHVKEGRHSPQTSLTFQQHEISSRGSPHSFCGESEMPRRSPLFPLEDTKVTKRSQKPITYNIEKVDMYSFNSFYKNEPSVFWGSRTCRHRWLCNADKIESRSAFSHAHGGDRIFDSCFTGPNLPSGVSSAFWGTRILNKHTSSGSQIVCKEAPCSGMGPNCHLRGGEGGGGGLHSGQCVCLDRRQVGTSVTVCQLYVTNTV